MKPILVPLRLIIENILIVYTYNMYFFIMVTLMINVFVFITTNIKPILMPFNITIENIYNNNLYK